MKRDFICILFVKGILVVSADGLYEYDAKRRRQLESAVIPFVIYQFLNGKVYTLLVSDGMCELYGKSREDIVEQFDNDMYRYTHPDDVQRISVCVLSSTAR